MCPAKLCKSNVPPMSQMTWRLDGKSLPNLGINQVHMLIELRAWTHRERERDRERVGFGFVYIFICYYLLSYWHPISFWLVESMYLVLSDDGHSQPRRSGDLFLAAWTGIQLFGTFRPGLWLVRQIQSSKYFDVGYDPWIPLACLTGRERVRERERDIYIYI